MGRGARVGAITALRAVAYVRVEGENFAVSDLATLQRWILEKRVLREDLCSADGAAWAPLGNRPELQLFFAASDRLDRTSPSAQHALLTMAHAASEDVFADAPLAGVEEDAGWLTDARTEFVPVPDSPTPARIELSQSLEPLEAAEAGDEDDEGNADRRHLTFSDEPELPPTASVRIAAPAIPEEPVAPAPPAKVEFGASDTAWMESDDALPPPPVLKPRPVPRPPGEPPTGPSVPAVPPGPPRLVPVPPPEGEEEGSHTALWVGVGICAVISVLLLLWAQGLLGPRMTVTEDEKSWSKPLPSGATIERPATPAETTATVEVRAGDREVTPHADEAGPLPATTPVEVAPGAPTPTRDLSPLAPTVGAPPPPAAPPPVEEAPAAKPVKTTKPPPTEPPPKAPPPTELVSGSTATTVTPTKATARAAAQPGWNDVEAQRWSDALAHFQSALQADSGNVWAIYGRAYVYEHTGKIDSATRDYCSALKRTRTAELTRELEAGLRRIGATCPE